MALDDRQRNRKAEAEAAGIPVAGRFEPDERRKRALPVVRGDAGPLVGERDLDGLPEIADGDPRAGAVFQRVVDQVSEGPLQREPPPRKNGGGDPPTA